MKKTIIGTFVALMCVVCVAPLNAFAINDNYVNCYDFNSDGEHTMSDLVLAKKLLDDGKIAEKDFLNVSNLVIGNDVEVSYEKFYLEEYEVNESSISDILSIIASHCVDYEFDGDEVRYCFLNDGIVTEMRCANIGISEEIVSTIIHDDVLNVIGVSPKEEFIIDSYRSFDIPHEFSEYEHWDLDSSSPSFANMMLTTSGKFQKFIVEQPESSTFVRFFFDNGVTVTELTIERIGEIQEEIRTFVYENEKITVGITADGKVAVDTYSFDIVD